MEKGDTIFVTSFGSEGILGVLDSIEGSTATLSSAVHFHIGKEPVTKKVKLCRKIDRSLSSVVSIDMADARAASRDEELSYRGKPLGGPETEGGTRNE